MILAAQIRDAVFERGIELIEGVRGNAGPDLLFDLGSRGQPARESHFTLPRKRRSQYAVIHLGDVAGDPTFALGAGEHRLQSLRSHLAGARDGSSAHALLLLDRVE